MACWDLHLHSLILAVMKISFASIIVASFITIIFNFKFFIVTIMAVIIFIIGNILNNNYFETQHNNWCLKLKVSFQLLFLSNFYFCKKEKWKDFKMKLFFADNFKKISPLFTGLAKLL